MCRKIMSTVLRRLVKSNYGHSDTIYLFFARALTLLTTASMSQYLSFLHCTRGSCSEVCTNASTCRSLYTPGRFKAVVGMCMGLHTSNCVVPNYRIESTMVSIVCQYMCVTAQNTLPMVGRCTLDNSGLTQTISRLSDRTDVHYTGPPRASA